MIKRQGFKTQVDGSSNLPQWNTCTFFFFWLSLLLDRKMCNNQENEKKIYTSL